MTIEVERLEGVNEEFNGKKGSADPAVFEKIGEKSRTWKGVCSCSYLLSSADQRARYMTFYVG